MAKVKQTQSLKDTAKEINTYNKKHKTNLSYGYYTALKREGKIKQ